MSLKIIFLTFKIVFKLEEYTKLFILLMCYHVKKIDNFFGTIMEKVGIIDCCIISS